MKRGRVFFKKKVAKPKPTKTVLDMINDAIDADDRREREERMKALENRGPDR